MTAQPKPKRQKQPSRKGLPSTVTKRPADLPYKYTPPAVQALPLTVDLNTVDDAEIIRCLEAGMTMREIARALNRDIGALARYLAQPQRTNRAREARRLSAIYWDEMAEQVLDDLPNDAGPAQCLKAREKASHYRWRAKCIAPQDYGDRPALDAEAEAARQAQAMGSDAARLVLAGVLAAIGLQVQPAAPEAIPGTARIINENKP